MWKKWKVAGSDTLLISGPPWLLDLHANIVYAIERDLAIIGIGAYASRTLHWPADALDAQVGIFTRIVRFTGRTYLGLLAVTCAAMLLVKADCGRLESTASVFVTTGGRQRNAG